MKKPVLHKPPMDAIVTVRLDRATVDALKASRINLSETVRKHLEKVARALPEPNGEEIGAK